jgi:hypothetical protein
VKKFEEANPARTAEGTDSNSPETRYPVVCIALCVGIAVTLEILIAANARLMTGDQTYRYMGKAIRFLANPFLPSLRDYPLPTLLQAGIHGSLFADHPLGIHWTSMVVLCLSRVLTVAGFVSFLTFVFRRSWVPFLAVAVFYLHAAYFEIYMFPTNWMVAACVSWGAFFLAVYWESFRSVYGLLAAAAVTLTVLTRIEWVLTLPTIAALGLVAAWLGKRRRVRELLPVVLMPLLPVLVVLALYWLLGLSAPGADLGKGGGVTAGFVFMNRHREIFGDVRHDWNYLEIILNEPVLFLRAVTVNVSYFIQHFLLRKANLPFGLLAVSGVLVAFRDRRYPVVLSWACFYAPFAVYFLTQLDNRYLFGWSLSMLFFCGYALAWGFRQPRTGHPILNAKSVSIAVACLLLLVYTPLSLRDSRKVWGHPGDLADVVLELKRAEHPRTMLIGLQSPGKSYALAAYVREKGHEIYLLNNRNCPYPPATELLAVTGPDAACTVVAHDSKLLAIEDLLLAPLPSPVDTFGSYSIHEITHEWLDKNGRALVPKD